MGEVSGFPKDFKVFEYSFLQSYNVDISAFGYDYLDIVADGLVNPLVNFPAGVFEPCLFVQFDGRERFFVNGELKNYPIRKYSNIKFYYVAPVADAAGLQGGFGKLYLIFKKFPTIDFAAHKICPSFCVNALVLGGGSEVNYWLGVDKIDGTYLVGIPYLPFGYNSISYIINSTATDWRVTLYEYFSCVDSVVTKVNTNTAVQNRASCFSNRYRLYLQNNDGTDKFIRVQLVFHDRDL